MKKLFSGLALLGVALMAYLLAWPVPIDPVAWTPSPSVKAEGIYAPNGLLKNIQRVAVGIGTGPEGIAVDALGRVYAGYADGRLVMMPATAESYQEIGRVRHGRPLGITFSPNGGLAIADAKKGLLSLGALPQAKSLVKTVDGRALIFANDVDNTRFDKNLYFTDSSHFDQAHALYDLLEHRPSGRLLEYNVASKQSRTLMEGLAFANGVAVGPDDAYVLVAETAASRIQRYWLKGEKAGTHEVFTDYLPGLPDNLSYDEANQIFWVALYAPRSEILESLADQPAWIKKVVARLPAFLQGGVTKKSWVLGIGLDGQVRYSLDDESTAAYAPITSVEAAGPWLWFGSISENSIGRLPLNKVIASAPPPPAGWQSAPATPKQIVTKQSKEEEREQKEEAEREGKNGAGNEDDDEEQEGRERAELKAR